MKKWKCLVCGQVFEGDAPPVPCPVCGAGESAFVLEEDLSKPRWHCTVCGQEFDGDAPPVPCPVCGAGASAFIRVEIVETEFQLDTNDEFVLVGGGVASLEAAKAIRKRNETAAITIVSGENRLPYNRPALSDVVEDGLSFPNIVLEEEDFYRQNNIKLLLGAEVTGVNSGEKTVELSNGDVLSYTKLLLATGSNPFNPIKAEYNAVPIKVLRSYDDAEEIIQYAGKTVVLVGGGILGLEAAVALRERQCKVTVVELADRILPLLTDPETSALLHKRLECIGIDLITGCSVTCADENGAVLNTGTHIKADLVLASLGIRSEVSLAVALGLELGRGIVVNETMKTSHKDIWAAGDCAEFEGRVQALVGAASNMGMVAGASMAGEEGVVYKPFVPASAFEVSGFSLLSVGIVNEAVPESMLYRNEQTGNYRRLFYKKGRLTGALFTGDNNPGAKAVKAVSTGQTKDQSIGLLLE